MRGAVRVCACHVAIASPSDHPSVLLLTTKALSKRILQQNSLARHWARDWRALALTQVHQKETTLDSCGAFYFPPTELCMPACPSRGPLVFAPQRGVPNPSAVRELKSLSSTHYALWLHGGLPLAEYLTRNRLALTSPLELPALRVSVTPLPAARPAPRAGRA